MNGTDAVALAPAHFSDTFPSDAEIEQAAFDDAVNSTDLFEPHGS